jgi:hypothetical protein
MSRELSPADIDFLVIGAAKSGTTWLHQMLKQHPQVFLPGPKELHYFNRRFTENPQVVNYNSEKPVSWYLSFFRPARPDQVLGEICPTYLWDEDAARRIHDFNPSLKLVAILRQPVERLYSYYLFLVQRGSLVDCSFAEALQRRPDLPARGNYYTHLSRFLALFPPEQLKVMLYDDLIADNRKFLLDVEDFLGLDEFIPPDIDQRSNITGAPRFKRLNHLLFQMRLFLRNNRFDWALDLLRKLGIAYALEQWRTRSAVPYEEKPLLDDSIKLELSDYYRDEIDKLEGLIQRDLSAWKV